MYTGPDTIKFRPHTLPVLCLLIPHDGLNQSRADVNCSHSQKSAVYSTISCVGTGVCPLPIPTPRFPNIIFRLTFIHLEIFAPKFYAYFCCLQPSDSTTRLFLQFHYHNKSIDHEFRHYAVSQTAQLRDTSYFKDPRYSLADVCDPRLSLNATNHVSPPFITNRTTSSKYKYFLKISIKRRSVVFFHLYDKRTNITLQPSGSGRIPVCTTRKSTPHGAFSHTCVFKAPLGFGYGNVTTRQGKAQSILK